MTRQRDLRYYLKYDRDPIKFKTSICKEFESRDLDMQRLRGEDLDFEEIREMVSKKRELDFGLFYEFLDHFHYHDGFESIRNAIKWILPQENSNTLPFELVPIITSPFKNWGSIISQEYSKVMAEEIQATILGRLESMNDDEMKEIEKTTINSLLTELREFLWISLDESSVDEKLETVKLTIALRFLKSTVMKKRLTGINEIKGIIEMTTDNIRRNWPDEDSPRRSKWIKPEYLCRWIYDNKLVEYLLGDSSHVELIKRSASVLRFLSVHKQLTKDHLELLWKWQDGKHEANVLGVFETIIEIWVDLSVDSLDYIF